EPYAAPSFEQLLAADDLVLDPLFVFRASQFLLGPLPAWFGDHDGVAFAQILMGCGVGFDVDPVIAHVGEHFPSARLSTAEAGASHALGINEHGTGVAELFHNRPGDFIFRFAAVIAR